MANICFTILHYRTPFVCALSVELEKRGHSVFFLCPSPKWKGWLLEQGISEEKILDQTLAVRPDPLSEMERTCLAEVEKVEQKSGITINSMILMDRLIREWAPDQAYNYLLRLFVLLKSFLVENKIDVVIGEATPANELLTAAVCEWIDIPYYFPITVRVPDDRFAFFKGRFHAEFALNKNTSDKERVSAEVWAEQFLTAFEQKKPKPSYWHKNNKLPSVQLVWVIKLVKTLVDEFKYRNSDPTRFDLGWLLKKRVGEVWNRYRLRAVSFHEVALDAKEKFILYPLHKQPESSVDVLGDFYSDQLNLIKQIVRSLPAGYKLYIKEHSNAIGDRPLGFYREIERLPNTRLISPYTDSFILLKLASVIVSISGTMAYEAGLLGRPAITFSRMFFCELPSIRYCSAVRDLPEIICDQILWQESGSDTARKKISFLSDLYLNSFEGTFSDINAYPEVLDKRNIMNVSNAVEAVL